MEINSAIQVQNIARQVMSALYEKIEVGMSEEAICHMAVQEFHKRSVENFWYYDIAAFVLAGDRTILSISGREYRPSQKPIVNGDLVTIDLSPELNGVWGDYARSLVVTQKMVYLDEFPSDGELKAGFVAEKKLHNLLLEVAHPELTFHDLHSTMNRAIQDLGFKNLDFKGNLGHSIEKNKEDRQYIECGNFSQLGQVNRFTFEPHISQVGSKRGFKRENIYYFSGERLKET